LLVVASPWLLGVQILFSLVFLARAGGQSGQSIDVLFRGTLPNSTALGEAVVLLLPWSVLASERAESRVASIARLVVAIASVALLAASASRVALAAAVLWAIWEVLGRTGVAERTRRLVVVVLVAVGVLGGAVLVTQDIRSGSTSQIGLRAEFAKLGARAAAASPLLGYGPDGFVAGGTSVSTRQVASLANPVIFQRGATDPHNLLVLVVVSTGLAGLALLVWALVETVIGWRIRSRAGVDVWPGVWAVGTALAVFLTAPATLAVLPLFAFVLGTSLAARPAERPDGARRVVGWTLVAVAGLASLLLAANAATRLPLERAGADVSPALASRAFTSADTWELDPYLWYLDSLHVGWAMQNDLSLARAQADLNAIERAAALDRRDPFIALELARTRRVRNRPADEVDAAFKDAIARWPLFPLAHYEYADFLASQGRTQEALRHLDELAGLNLNEPAFDQAIQELRQKILEQQ
ncbi:MAG: hypothetical protein HY876_03820, partial [Coriobacteriales bacterium]|nr:hypothetical protein [Coriobacteriales bacterium]